MTERPLATSEARDVLAAMVARVAQDAHLDLLLVKGPSLSFHGLRAERGWGDVDILVRPDHAGPLRRLLEKSGWAAFNEPSQYPLIAVPHAITLIHPRWHTEIDLHTFFPGCYADPESTFTQLWEEQTCIELAHQPVPCTGLIGSALIAAVNLARMPMEPRSLVEVEQWNAAVSRWSDADKSSLTRLAADCRASEVVAPLFATVDISPLDHGAMTKDDWADWRNRVLGGGRTGYGWWVAFRRAPLRRKPRQLMRALSFDPQAAAGGLPQPTGWSRLRQVARRIGQGIAKAVRWNS
ncbi:hypothetical protein J2X11_001013 [Aeromicrobium panaciterrae]|uniref:Nucleotidyltransferase family protein n=1 Tax=Aeromicrobium panaciterrae TaxID=363861 RepID=A0ABU1ULW4_9ACTN|nr:nucleotidyltransferase family protein [Aeromicrobium panaciterrae]MDR7086174.1 hypothetical protein [Aeromicrobium panaciterrae]